MTIIALIAALPLFLQPAASNICPVNRYTAPGVDVCYEIVSSAKNPAGVDAQAIDLTNLKYLQTQWLDADTMLSKMETATTTFCWYDDRTTSTFPCE